VESLLLNLVDPSAEVARDYRLSIIETRDGGTVSRHSIPNAKMLQEAVR
jgi:hypothetical protein